MTATQSHMQVFAAMRNAPVKKVSPVVGPIQQCAHVLDGAVWCDACATAQLDYARKLHAKAMSQSTRYAVRAAAQSLLTKAVTEYSITNTGLTSLEKQYLSQVQSGQTQKAQKTYSQIQQVKRSRQVRSQKARELAAKKLSIMKAAELFTKRHALPQVDSAGRATMQGTELRYTRHAVQRMDERQISELDVQHVLSHQVVIDKRNNSTWGVKGEQVTLIGVFLDEPRGKVFVVKTLWRNEASQEEQEAELSTAQ
jgi:hypothetical protein